MSFLNSCLHIIYLCAIIVVFARQSTDDDAGCKICYRSIQNSAEPGLTNSPNNLIACRHKIYCPECIDLEVSYNRAHCGYCTIKFHSLESINAKALLADLDLNPCTQLLSLSLTSSKEVNEVIKIFVILPRKESGYTTFPMANWALLREAVNEMDSSKEAKSHILSQIARMETKTLSLKIEIGDTVSRWLIISEPWENPEAEYRSTVFAIHSKATVWKVDDVLHEQQYTTASHLNFSDPFDEEGNVLREAKENPVALTYRRIEVYNAVKNLQENVDLHFTLGLTLPKEITQVLILMLLSVNEFPHADLRMSIRPKVWDHLNDELLAKNYFHDVVSELEFLIQVQHMKTIDVAIHTQRAFPDKRWLIWVEEKRDDRTERTLYHTIVILYDLSTREHKRMIDTIAPIIPYLDTSRCLAKHLQMAYSYRPAIPLVLDKSINDFPGLQLRKFSHVPLVDELIKEFVIEICSSEVSDDGSPTRYVRRQIYGLGHYIKYEGLLIDRLEDLRAKAADTLELDEYTQLFHEVESLTLLPDPVRSFREEGAVVLYISRRLDRLNLPGKEDVEVLLYAILDDGSVPLIKTMDKIIPTSENPKFPNGKSVPFHPYEDTGHRNIKTLRLSDNFELNSFFQAQIRRDSRYSYSRTIPIEFLREYFHEYRLHPATKEAVEQEIEEFADGGIQVARDASKNCVVALAKKVKASMGTDTHAETRVFYLTDGDEILVHFRKGVVAHLPLPSHTSAIQVSSPHITKELRHFDFSSRLSIYTIMELVFENFIRSHVVAALPEKDFLQEFKLREAAFETYPSSGDSEFAVYIRGIALGSVELVIKSKGLYYERYLYITQKLDVNAMVPKENLLLVFAINAQGDRVLVKETEIESEEKSCRHLVEVEWGFNEDGSPKSEINPRNNALRGVPG